MLLHAKFFGYCRLGDASLMGGIRFMQETANWQEIRNQAVFGVETIEKKTVGSDENKKVIVNAFGSKVFTLSKGHDRIFFAAKEYEVDYESRQGKYQIFQFSAKDNEKLKKLIDNE